MSAPWETPSEWQTAYKLLYSSNKTSKREGLIVMMRWDKKSRRLPLSVECTRELVRASLESGPRTAQISAYSLAIVRFVNGHIDSVAFARSVNNVAAEISIPNWIIEIRNNTLQGLSPSFDFGLLRRAAKYALSWLEERYWKPQNQCHVDYANLQRRLESGNKKTESRKKKSQAATSMINDVVPESTKKQAPKNSTYYVQPPKCDKKKGQGYNKVAYDYRNMGPRPVPDRYYRMHLVPWNDINDKYNEIQSKYPEKNEKCMIHYEHVRSTQMKKPQNQKVRSFRNKGPTQQTIQQQINKQKQGKSSKSKDVREKLIVPPAPIRNSISVVNKNELSKKTKDTPKVAQKLINNDPLTLTTKLEYKEDVSSRGKETKSAAVSSIRNGPSVTRKGMKEQVSKKEKQIDPPKPSISCPSVTKNDRKKQVSNMMKKERVKCKDEIVRPPTLNLVEDLTLELSRCSTSDREGTASPGFIQSIKGLYDYVYNGNAFGWIAGSNPITAR